MTTLYDKVASSVPTGLDRKESEVYRHLDPARLPKHIAIIMDGNGRWAKRRHMPRVAGHRAGVTAVRSTVETAARIHIPALTLYAFSEENWKKRPKSEVGFLMGLLSRYLKAEVPPRRRILRDKSSLVRGLLAHVHLWLVISGKWIGILQALLR